MKDTFKDNSEINVGDIISCQIGYSMLIPKFYKVLSRAGKRSINIQELQTRTVSGNGWQGECIPGTCFKDHSRPFQARISKYGVLNVDGHCGWIWDGKPSMYDFMD